MSDSSNGPIEPPTEKVGWKRRLFGRFFPDFDHRLVKDLRRQRRPIAFGLTCAILTSLLSSGMILLIKFSVQAISDAGNLAEQRVLDHGDMLKLAGSLDRAHVDVSRALAQVEGTRHPNGALLSKQEEVQLAKALDLAPEKVESALKKLEASHPRSRQRPIDAVTRLGYLSLIVVALFGAKYWFTRGQTYYLSYAASKLANDLRVRLFGKLQRLPMSYFNDKRAGAIQSILTTDVGVYQSAVGIIRDSIDAPIKAISSLAAIFYLQWQLAFVAMLFMPPMAWAIQRNAKRMRIAQRKVQHDLAELGAMTQEALQGTRVVKAFSAEAEIEGRYGELVSASFESQMTAARRVAALRPLVEFIGALAIAAVIYICGWLAYKGSLQVADIAALIFGLDVINQGFRSWGNFKNTLAQVRAASDRVYSEILDVDDEPGDEPGGKVIESPRGLIEFRNVSFRYPDGTLALDRVSFTIEPGTSLALVGRSGAGKSTIADLMLRFYDPTSGQVLFDGVDLRELKVSWLRSQIGVVPQQTFLFAGSIEDNVRMGQPHASASQVAEALRQAHAEEFVAEMSQRTNSELGERGVKLSGGQMQRVAIARALVRRPRILLLDEATSALDANSEKAVTEALEEVMKTRTTLFIAHRLTTAARADRILHLRQGEVVEVGTHRDLLERNGPYADMYRAFSEGVMDEALDA